ncbi:hypothetical protein ASD56_04985 [Microbacterium sp. Root166]|uniref:hypothetical protein n=1 Tax=Microbacterium sp. Root166 TaxID=1736478 RepID=UPI0006FA4127|nr:hypothetical protein [Microbacterium sp. Root166]KQZ85658.1 hypothetical protein ASD56_04985 [Microbacterium sp. Root166]
MSSSGSVSPDARNRLFAFSGSVWIGGLVVIALIGWATFADLPDSVTAQGDYTYAPWENPDPTAAEAEGDGIYSGRDGDVIRLDDLDPSQPLLVTELDDTYVGGVTVTGPGGEALVEGEYGDPPTFESYAYGLDGQYVIVTSSSAELWIDGFSDEAWRLKISTPEVPDESGTVSGIGPMVFAYSGAATTARVSTRGEGSVGIETATAQGVTEILYEADPVDRSIAWEDGDLVLFVVDAYADAGWTIAFDDDAPAPAPTATPSPTGGDG